MARCCLEFSNGGVLLLLVLVLVLLFLLVVVAGETPHDIHSSQGAMQNVLFHNCQLNKLPPQTNVKSLEAVKIAGCSSF